MNLFLNILTGAVGGMILVAGIGALAVGTWYSINFLIATLGFIWSFGVLMLAVGALAGGHTAYIQYTQKSAKEQTQ